MPQGPTTSYQDGQSMTRSSPAAESWGAFVRARLAALKMTQADLRRAMELEGFPISRQAASQWFNGENAADPNLATVAASALRADPAEAMRAAGYATAVNRLVPDGSSGDEAVEEFDPIIEDIMRMTHLGLKVRQALIAQYLAEEEEADQQRETKRESARRRARELAKALPSEDAGGSAGVSA